MELTVQKWVLIVRPKIPQMPQKISAQNVCQRFKIFEKKNFFWVSLVRDVTHGLLHVRTVGRSVHDWDLEYNETDFNSLSDFIRNFENYNNSRSLNLDLISTQICMGKIPYVQK